MTDDEVVGAIARLVAAGEYLDEIPGVPGARLDGGGVFAGDRRLYERGSPEYIEARAAGLIDPLPPLGLTSPAAVTDAERSIGHPIPKLLRRLLLEVGNGGFGPGYGVFGVPDAAIAYAEIQAARPSLPAALLPICDWGCGIASLVDCASPRGDMWGCDPNPGVDDDVFRQPLTLTDWFARWVEGRLNQPALIEDPESGEIRPATDEDFEDWAREDAHQ